MEIYQNTVWVLNGETELKVDDQVEVELKSGEKIIGEVTDIIGELLIVNSNSLGDVEIEMQEVCYIHIK